MQNADPNRNSFRSNRTRGAPHVLPELSTTAKPTSAPSNSGIGLKFPESPNIMQKLSEITGTTENPVDNILSKGKELIFMKFGLGKWCKIDYSAFISLPLYFFLTFIYFLYRILFFTWKFCLEMAPQRLKKYYYATRNLLNLETQRDLELRNI